MKTKQELTEVTKAFFGELDMLQQKHQKLKPEEEEVLVSKRMNEMGIRDSFDMCRFLYEVM